MKKLLAFSSLILLLSACGSPTAPEPVVEETPKEINTEPVPEVEQAVEEVVKETHLYQPSLQEFFHDMPAPFCNTDLDLEIWDESNYYGFLDSHKEGHSMPTRMYCEFAIFLNTAGGHNIYGVISADEGPMGIRGEIGFYQYISGKWSKMDGNVLGFEGVEGSYIKLPQYGTEVQQIKWSTEEVLAKSKWTGTQFIIVE